MDEDVKNEPCLKCGKSDHMDGAEYCSNCGQFLINYCANNFCDMNNGESVPLTYKDRYCPYCGGPSTYLDEGLIKPLEEE